MKVHPSNFCCLNDNEYSSDKTTKNPIVSHKNPNVVFNYLSAIGNYNITFSAAKNPFYSIDENGNYIRFTDRKVAEETLSLAKSNIAECLQGKRTATHGYSFCYASEIETTDETGNIKIDEEKLNKKIEETKLALQSRDIPIPIYAISPNGTYKKFPSKYQAGKQLGISVPHLLKCLNGELNKTGGYTFVFPEEIEEKDKDGNIFVSRRKVDDIASTSFLNTKATPLYAIDKYGNHRRFAGIRIAARELSLECANISRCLQGGQKRVGEYTFVRAQDVEKKDKNNRLTLDTEKMEEINQTSLEMKNYVPVYTIRYDGKITKHANQNRAARAIGVKADALRHCLGGRYSVINGHSVAYAKDIEKINDEGKTELNFELLEEKYNEANKNAIYAIYPDGTHKKYVTQAQAAEELGIRRTKIAQCLTGESNMTAGRTFVKASDVETFSKGHIILNRNLIKKFSVSLLSTSKLRAIYAFDEKGNYVRYGSIKQATDGLSIGKTNIALCLNGQQKSSKSYHFIYASDVEQYDENGTLIIDYDKIDEIREEINPAIRKRNKKYGKIYALSGVNIKEFENISIAARELNIDANDIEHLLKTGRNRNNGASSINGYVFTCENDEKETK